MMQYTDTAVECVSLSQLSEISGINKNTLRRYLHAGELKAYRTPGGRYAIPLQDGLSFCYSLHQSGRVKGWTLDYIERYLQSGLYYSSPYETDD